jgi:signal transduction histidine kinase
MYHFSFKNRLAFNYLISTALMVLFVFVIIYNIVSYTVNSHVDHTIEYEVKDHLSQIGVDKNNVCVINPKEWLELEYKSLNISPVFVQILDAQKKRVGKTPNLKEHDLIFNQDMKDFKSFDTRLAGKAIRQIQFPVKSDGKTAGYILIAMSLEDANLVLQNLSRTLWISYPIILILLFGAARFIAGRNIRPITSITQTAREITRENLKSRIELPQNRDELFTLSKTINDLLDRLANAIDREKQFTSDASHELRTPLAVIKGTLEVLIRKPRDTKEYEEKIKYCISEVDRLNKLVDQLLLLARFENQQVITDLQEVRLNAVIMQSLERFSAEAKKKNLRIDFVSKQDFTIVSDSYLVSIIVENLLSNACKYSNDGGKISIVLSKENDVIACQISDNGIGIPEDDLDKIYEQFYRAEATAHPSIKGTGLGLSIVKRLCDLLKIDIAIESVQQSGTIVKIRFPG